MKRILALVCLGIAMKGAAQVKLPALIGDNMVLQRSVQAPVWGWAAPGEGVEVVFKETTYRAVAGQDGKWMVKLDAGKAGGPFDMTISGKSNRIQIKNILVGEVWIASGQSNMELGIQSDSCGTEAIAAATDSMIHFFWVPMAASLQPEKEIAATAAGSLNGKWVVCSPTVMATTSWAWHGFSAAGYYFARDIRKATGSPVGMIGSYKGGTPAQAWISVDGLQQSPAFDRHVTAHQLVADNYEKAKADYPAKRAAFQEELKKWNNATTTPRPREPLTPEGGFSAPGNLYNAMIAPLIPYAIKGVIWYQGESNGDKIGDACEYATLFPRLITNWREKWGIGDFSFLFVQLTSFRQPAKTPDEGNWAWVRDAQSRSLSLPNTGMAVITDIGNANDIHPKDKLHVGLRLAAAARHVAYGEKNVYTGPVYRSMKVKGNTVTLSFDQTGSGLDARNLAGFGIAGADGKFIWATAAVKGDKIIVSADGVAAPVAVRYNWGDNPPGALFNKEGLPASPFRTDNWPCPADKK